MEQPHNLEAEEALLSAVFSGANPKYIDVSEGDFYTQRNADLWRAIRIVCSNGMDIDIVTISDELRKMGVYADVGGDAFLMDISMRFGLYGSVESYANIIREMSRRRKMIATAQRMANSAFDLTVQPDRIASEAMTEIANSANTTDGATHISEYLSVLYDKVTDATENPCDVPGLSFGMSDMDEVTLGAQTGTQMNIGGEPGIGKTTLAFQWAVSFGNQQPGAIFSMEMSGVSALRRVVSNESGVTPRKMITGRFADADHAGFVGAIDRLSQLPVYMSDSTRWTSQTMRSELARLKQRYEIKWFLLDIFCQWIPRIRRSLASIHHGNICIILFRFHRFALHSRAGAIFESSACTKVGKSGLRVSAIFRPMPSRFFFHSRLTIFSPPLVRIIARSASYIRCTLPANPP